MQQHTFNDVISCTQGNNGYMTCLPYDRTPGFKACLGNQIGTRLYDMRITSELP